jgi:hypothetical protein
MAKNSICTRLRPEEFRHFSELLANDDHFPKTYGAWLAQTAHFGALTAHTVVEIRAGEFEAYCRSQNTPPRLALLTALATEKLSLTN